MTNWMEKKAQQEMLKRAMEAGWTASTCIGMAFGPLAVALEMGNASRSDVDQLLDDWLRVWEDVRKLSDRNLHRNRPYYEVRPNEMLSPILLEFEQALLRVRQDADLDGASAMAALKEIYMATTVELFEFNEWAKSVGPSVSFDSTKYEGTAVRKAQGYWAPTVRRLQRMMG